jgi:hypothetical protein
MAFDTLQQTISVILGEQHISFNDGYASPVAIEETAMNEFVLLCATGYGNGYLLIQLDSLLKQKSMQALPATYRLISMNAAGDGNYIFTGSTISPDKGNQLIKMKGDGSQLWNKALSSDDTYSYATPTPDGGYIVIGSRPVSTGYWNYTSIVIKTDGNGVQQWVKVFDKEEMINSDNAVLEPDGIVLGGRKPGMGLATDSVFVVKLNLSGHVIWRNTAVGGLNRSLGNTRIAKLENANYAITSGGGRGIFLFSPSGDFLDRKLASNEVTDAISSDDGNLIALQTEPGNGSRIQVSKLMLDGRVQWSAYPDGRQKQPRGGFSCCASSWPVAVRPLQHGGSITLGYQVVDNGSGIRTDVVIMELDEAGMSK